MKPIIILITLLSAISLSLRFEYGQQEINFESIKINDVEWMGTDLDISTFRNGDSIAEVKTQEQWVEYAIEGKPAYCYYGFDKTLRKQKGKLYNWFAVNDPRGLAPVGWHLASLEEWMAMIEFLDGKTSAGLQLKSTEGWSKNGNGNNHTGFSAFPGGICTSSGNFNSIHDYISWWTSSESNKEKAWQIYMISSNSEVNRYSMEKGAGFYVRCVKDK